MLLFLIISTDVLFHISEEVHIVGGIVYSVVIMEQDQLFLSCMCCHMTRRPYV